MDCGEIVVLVVGLVRKGPCGQDRVTEVYQANDREKGFVQTWS